MYISKQLYTGCTRTIALPLKDRFLRIFQDKNPNKKVSKI